MSGQSNNTTILSADNQLIITQNEQTTELNDIEQAILSLKAVIASTGSGGSGMAGTNDGPTGVQDWVGIDPLEDFTPEQMNKRCTVVNFIFDGIYGIAYDLGESPLQAELALGGAIVSGIPAEILAGCVFVGSPAIAATVSVTLVAVIGYMVYTSTQFTEIAEDLLTAKQAIINDLYKSQDIYQAKAAFTDNCPDLSGPNKFVLGLLTHTDIVKYLFISNFEVPAGYTPTEPCEDLDSDLGEWVAFDSNMSAIPGASTRYYDYFELEAPTGTVYGGGGWADRYYLFAGNTDTQTTTKRRFTIDCLDSSYTIGGITGVSDPLFYSQLPIIQGNTIVPTIITPGKVYEVTGCNYVRVDTIQGSAGLKMKIEVVVE